MKASSAFPLLIAKKLNLYNVHLANIQLSSQNAYKVKKTAAFNSRATTAENNKGLVSFLCL